MSRAVVASIAAIVALGAVFVLSVLVIDASHDDEIADGIRIGSLDVGGLAVGQARERVQRELAGSVRRPVTV